MKKGLLFFLGYIVMLSVQGQTVESELRSKFARFENDAQLQSGIASLYVIDAATGTVVFEKNSQVGLAPASTQKIITSATAYTLLGKDFRYQTTMAYDGTIVDKTLQGNIYITGSGDPTLGSWRWPQTKAEAVINRMTGAINSLQIQSFEKVIFDNSNWEYETIPDGWIWQDIGSYYGAGAAKYNWHENQYDIQLQSGSALGDPVHITGTSASISIPLVSLATSAARGTGDNAYVYYPLLSDTGVVRGTIPVHEKAFTISASLPQPQAGFLQSLNASLQQQPITYQKGFYQLDSREKMKASPMVFHTEYSPTLDSIVYWFLKKSINLYGEALLKTLACQQKGMGSTDTGIAVVQSFWKEKGITPIALNIVDGSGLSPLNRMTTQAQVKVLQYARSQPWFSGFYKALPEYNDMKMKSGTIHGVKGFAGYHTSKKGRTYIFSFLVNNYNGPSASLVQKMYEVLNVLK